MQMTKVGRAGCNKAEERATFDLDQNTHKFGMDNGDQSEALEGTSATGNYLSVGVGGAHVAPFFLFRRIVS